MNPVTVKLAVFFAVTGFLWFVSRASLRKVKSHGFYRFFAWVAIVALILTNVDAWFVDPLSIRQVLSWALLVLSLVVLVPGAKHLIGRGMPTAERQDDTLIGFEKTSVLVTSGIYRYIRHPLYASLLFLTWGAFLKEVSWSSTCLTVLATGLLVATAKADEKECLRYFGVAYQEYMTRTKMFIPAVW